MKADEFGAKRIKADKSG